MINNAAESWPAVYDQICTSKSLSRLPESGLNRLEIALLNSQEHLQRVLLKSTEMLLKRPGRPLAEPQDIRFLLLLLVNPLLQPSFRVFDGFNSDQDGRGRGSDHIDGKDDRNNPGKHSGIIKRILGLMSNSSETCHHHLVSWLARLPDHLFLQAKDMVSRFVTYRLSRQSDKKPEVRVDVTADLIPQMPSGRPGNAVASLHAALGGSKPNSQKKQKQAAIAAEMKKVIYGDDWQIKAAARVMALIFAANKMTRANKDEQALQRSHGSTNLLTTSDFYNTLLDCLDLTADFEAWEARRGKFAFCQYPFFLSIWAKIQILEFDARRQMTVKAREAFFDSIMTRKNVSQYLVLNIRRDCLIEDSLQEVSEVVGSGSEDIKKSLRIEFKGEEGIDAGGLRKEWFLLLVREVFNPEHG